MISMEGVPSSLILRNESWVRKHAHAMARHLPSSVERADLIQAGLIAVAQAAMGFEWTGDRDTPEAREAFVRYARQRVHGAMIDELRQMDHMSRSRRRQVKLLQVTRERWRHANDREPTATDLSPLCGLSVEEIYGLEHEALLAQSVSLSEHDDDDDAVPHHEPATPQDEVEARVDTGMLMRRLESFFATLPERDRRVIDAYLGVGLSPAQLAQEMNVSASRVSQMFRQVCDRIEVHLGHEGQRCTDRADRREQFDELIREREADLARQAHGGAWSERLEKILIAPQDLAAHYPEGAPIVIEPGTRWG